MTRKGFGRPHLIPYPSIVHSRSIMPETSPGLLTPHVRSSLAHSLFTRLLQPADRMAREHARPFCQGLEPMGEGAATRTTLPPPPLLRSPLASPWSGPARSQQRSSPHVALSFSCSRFTPFPPSTSSSFTAAGHRLYEARAQPQQVRRPHQRLRVVAWSPRSPVALRVHTLS